MNTPRFGDVHNYGILNTGKVHGDVVQNIESAMEPQAGQSEQIAELRTRLVELADLIKSHEDDIASSQQDLRRVESVAHELGNDAPDRLIVMRYLDLLSESLAKVPPIMATVVTIRELVTKLV